MKVKLLYFAWVREKTGLGEEMAELPASIRTVRDLLGWQKQRGEDFARAFEDEDTIRVALDQQHAATDDLLQDAREIAFFPPVTGG